MTDVPDEDDVCLVWTADVEPHTLGHRVGAEKSDKYLFSQPVAVANKPCVLSYTVRAADRFKLLNFWMAIGGVCMDSDLVGVNKLKELKKQMTENRTATHGQFKDLLVKLARRRIVLLPCTTAHASKQDVVDNHYRDAFREAIAGSIVVLQHVDERTGACAMFGIGVVAEKAMVNDQGVHAFADPKDSGIFLPVMIIEIFDTNPFDADAGAHGGVFAGGHDRGEDMTKICISQATVDRRALPHPLAVWITENALQDASEAIRTLGDAAVSQGLRGHLATETRRAILLRSIARGTTASGMQPLRDLFDKPSGQRALDCEPCFPPSKKRGRAGEVLGELVTLYKHRRVSSWGAP